MIGTPVTNGNMMIESLERVELGAALKPEDVKIQCRLAVELLEVLGNELPREKTLLSPLDHPHGARRQ